MANLFERTKISVLAKQQRDKRDDRYAARVVSETATVVSPKAVMVGSTIYRASVPGAVAGEQVAVVDQGGGSALYTPANASIVGGSGSSGSTGGTGGAAMTQHNITGSYHAASGLTAGQVIKATSPTTFGWRSLLWGEVDKTTSSIADIATRSHSLLSGIGANDHHNQQHILATTSALGGDHTVSGLTTGQVLRATGATTAAFGSLLWSEVNKSTSSIADITTRSHGLLSGIGANDHHNQQHVITGGDHTVTGSTLDIVGLSSTNTLGILTPSSTPSGSSILKSNSSGGLTLLGLSVAADTDVTVPIGRVKLFSVATDNAAIAHYDHANSTGYSWRQTAAGITVLNAPSGQSILHKINNSDVMSMDADGLTLENGKALDANYVSGWAGSGYRIDSNLSISGESFAEFDNLSVRGTMNVYELVVNQIRATNGTIIVSSAGKIASVSGSNWTLEDPEGNNLCPFATNDIVIIQNVDTDASTIVKRIVRRVTAVSGKTITVTAASGGPTDSGSPAKGDVVVRIGNSTNTSRQGVVLITSDMSNSPYMDVVSGVTSWSDWTGGTKTKCRLGLLSGLSIGSANEYGLFAGTGSTASDSYIRVSSYAQESNNLASTWKTGGSTFLSIDASNGVTINTSTAYLSQRAYTFNDGSEAGGLYAYSTGPGRGLSLETQPTTKGSVLNLLSESNSGYTAQSLLYAKSGSNQASVSVDVSAGGARTITLAADSHALSVIGGGNPITASSDGLQVGVSMGSYASTLGSDANVRLGVYTTAGTDIPSIVFENPSGTLASIRSNAGLTARIGSTDVLSIGALGVSVTGTFSSSGRIDAPAGEGIRITGSATGATSVAYMSFYDSGGTRKGFVGDSSSANSNITLLSDAGDVILRDSSSTNALIVSGGNVTLAGTLDLAGFTASWTAATYNTNWSSYSASFADASYCRIGDLVLVNGLVKRTSGNSTTTVFTLPSGYRPTTQKSFYTRMEVGGVESAYRIDVATSGAVSITYTGTSTINALSLDCIQFRTNL